MRRRGSPVPRIVGACAVSLVGNLLVFNQVFAPLKFGPVDVVEMTFDDDRPSDDDPEAAPPEPDKLADKKKQKEKEKKKDKDKQKTEVAMVPPPPPQPAPPQPPPPPPPPPTPPPPLEQRQRLKSVSQDQFPDEDTNNNAEFLAEKNHKVKENTRAASTNLVHRSEGEQPPTEESQNRDDKVGAAEDKIAELQNQEGKKPIAPDSAQPGKEQAPTESEKPRVGALSMRNLVPQAEEKRRERREGVELDDPSPGNLAKARQGADKQRAEAPRRGTNLNLKLDATGYDKLVGYDIAAAERRQAALAQRSGPKGRYDRYLTKLKAMQSSLENFIPEVKVGNQQELGTRQDPFAKYITAMHRQIHKQFTFGFLQSIESNLGKSGHYEDMTLWTQLEIVLNKDGTVDKVTIVRTSGNSPYDTAAIDSVLSAAPFPEPPPVIRSTNGKVYLDWKFHRDERACGTYGVDPHILTMPGETIQHDTTEIQRASLPQKKM